MVAKKQVAKKTANEVALADDFLIQADDVDVNELDSDSFAIPRLALLEKLSPQLDENEAAYIAAAKAGQICNSVTDEIMDSIEVIPCLRKRVFLEWTPRAAGGGFNGAYNIPEGTALMKTTTRDDKNNDVLPNGNELHDTQEFYVLYRAVGSTERMQPAIISMTRTRLKEAKKWNFRINSRTVNGQRVKDTAQVFNMSTVVRQGEQGNSYMWKVGDSNLVPTVFGADAIEVFTMANTFRDSVASGEKGVDYEKEGEKSDNFADFGDEKEAF